MHRLAPGSRLHRQARCLPLRFRTTRQSDVRELDYSQKIMLFQFESEINLGIIKIQPT
jgi:hypothetical protein